MTSQISRRPNFTTQHVDQSEHNFVEFPAMGRISEKTQKNRKNFQRLATQAAITPQ